MPDRQKIDVFASRQHGCFSLRQAREAGFDKDATRRRLLSGEWIRLAPTVYAVASSPPIWDRQMAAAVLSRSRALVAGRSAAYLHGLAGFSPSRPQILVPHASNVRSDIADVAKTRFFDEIRSVRRRAFDTTSVAETILFLAGRGKAIDDVFEDALISGKLDVTDFEPIFRREADSRQRGIVQIRELVEIHGDFAPAYSSNYLEGLLEMVLGRLPMPPWFREHPFTIHGQPSRVDVWIPEWRLVVEADGRTTHAQRAAYESDRRRDNGLAVQGIQVIRLTYKMLTEEPATCAATLLNVGRLRSRESTRAS
jgi:hypothetical protein